MISIPSTSMPRSLQVLQPWAGIIFAHAAQQPKLALPHQESPGGVQRASTGCIQQRLSNGWQDIFPRKVPCNDIGGFHAGGCLGCHAMREDQESAGWRSQVELRP